MKFIIRRGVVLGMTFFFLLKGVGQSGPVAIPFGGNAWSNRPTGGAITNSGITGWTDAATSFTLYFRVTRPVPVHAWIYCSVASGKSRIRISPGRVDMNGGVVAAGEAGKELEVTGVGLQRYDAGGWDIRDTGYQTIRIEGVSRSGETFGDIQRVELSGEGLEGPLAGDGKGTASAAGQGASVGEGRGASAGVGGSSSTGNAVISYVPNNDGNFFHWGRRGPSVHLAYAQPPGVHAEWFYNEVTVPEGQDIEGSYFMADGFGEGYFGMQVNSPTERHILFSVWSPFQTDDPHSIPDSLQILLAKKGEGVHAGAFGNEGSGGQSWLNYPWKAGNIYRFLLHAQPLEHNYTQFTAWWYAPEEGKWRLIASFKRPKSQPWLGGLHSFLENFEPVMGDRQRTVLFRHQWIRDEQGNWISLNRARFTGDNTARKGYRMDYGGGIKGDAYYLRNCGFFNDYTPLNGWWERAAEPGTKAPDIDLTQLP